MLFKPRQKRQNINLQVYINEQEIEQVKEIFLGVFLDNLKICLGRLTFLMKQTKFQNRLE